MKEKYCCILVMILLLSLPLFSQSSNRAPVVENVSYTQRTDGTLKVDVYYDVTDADGDTVSVTMAASSDNGVTWTYGCAAVSGDVGAKIRPGTARHIIWDFNTDHSRVSGSQFKVKVSADDRKGGSQGGPMQWVTVAAGPFTWGQSDAGQTITYAYQIGKYPVTNRQYIEFLQSALAAGKITVSGVEVRGNYPGDNQWPAGERVLYYLRENVSSNVGRIDFSDGKFTLLPNDTFLDHPVVFVTWFGAWAFADYYGFRLPTEEEWEKAARGNTGYDFPWGNSVTGVRANYNTSGDPFDNGTTPVGYYNGQNYGTFQTTDSPSPYGAYDMAGNVWQWTNSYYGDSYPNMRVLRGGSWSKDWGYLRSWYRIYDYPTYRSYNFGIRCARTL